MAGQIEARKTDKVMVIETCVTNRCSCGTLFIVICVNANIDIVFVFKIVITSLTPVSL